jgi:Uma2 family endonuclease
MTTFTSKTLITAEELFQMGDIGRCELVRGEIVHMAPAGAEHGDIAGELLFRIKQYVRAKRLGKVFAAETGFIISRNPDTARAADVSFVSAERIPPTRVRGFFPGPPDLAVEVVSPSDHRSAVSAKVEEWLAAGTKSVWVVDPLNRSIEAHGQMGDVRIYRADQKLTDEPTLPGFVLPLMEVFDAEA